MEFIDHISLLDIKDRKVLLCLTIGKTKWQLPGGKRNAGETDQQALIRECKEELNVVIDQESIKLYEEIEGLAFGKDNDLKVRIKIFTALFSGNTTPSNEVEKAEYLKFGEVDDTSELGWEFLKKLHSKGFIE